MEAREREEKGKESGRHSEALFLAEPRACRNVPAEWWLSYNLTSKGMAEAWRDGCNPGRQPWSSPRVMRGKNCFCSYKLLNLAAPLKHNLPETSASPQKSLAFEWALEQAKCLFTWPHHCLIIATWGSKWKLGLSFMFYSWRNKARIPETSNKVPKVTGAARPKIQPPTVLHAMLACLPAKSWTRMRNTRPGWFSWSRAAQAKFAGRSF